MTEPATGPVIQNGIHTKTNRAAMPMQRNVAWALAAPPL